MQDFSNLRIVCVEPSFLDMSPQQELDALREYLDRLEAK